MLYKSYTPIIQIQNHRPPKILNQKWPFLSVECHIWDSMNSWCAIFITKMSMRHFVKDLLIRMPAEHRIYWDQINGFLPLLSRGVAMVQWLLWQHGLLSFQRRDTKSDVFLPIFFSIDVFWHLQFCWNALFSKLMPYFLTNSYS